MIEPFVKREFRGTETECLQQAAADAGPAAAHGYVPSSMLWSDDASGRLLTVIYERRPPSAQDRFAAHDDVASGPAPGFVYVGFWRRAVASVLDGVLLGVVTVALVTAGLWNDLRSLAVAAEHGPLFTINRVTGRVIAADPLVTSVVRHMLGTLLVVWLLLLVIQLAYHVALWTLFGGTLGQRALGMEIRRATDGSRVGLGRSFVRYVGYVLCSLVLGLGFLWAAFDPRKQGWHDKLAGTVVVRRQG